MPAHKKSSFDTLNCPECDNPVKPLKVTAGPTVWYKCECKTSWRINRWGDGTHYRVPSGHKFCVGKE